jgi:TolB-like protein
VLGDAARNPLFIETVANHGYKFIAPVTTEATEPAAEPAVTVESVPEPSAVPAPVSASPWTTRTVALTGGLAAGAALVAIVLGFDLFGAGTWLRRQTTASVRSIAVLPLENMSKDADQEYLVDGVTEQLITALAQLPDLRVISRTSAMQFKGAAKTLPQIGRELGVDTIVSGSVTRSADRIRVTAQLVDVRTDQHLWASSYERNLGEVLDLQSEIARAIADEIRVRLTPAQQGVLARAHGVDPRSEDAYLRGRYHLNQGTEPALRKALDNFAGAIAIDGSDARSYAATAWTYVSLTDYWERPSAAMPRARAAAEHALRLDPRLADAHAAMGAVRFLYDWDWRSADAQLKTAIELAPASVDAHLWYGVFLGQMGRSAEAIAEVERAERLDPLSIPVHINAGWVYYLARQTERATAQWQKALDLDPNLGIIHTSIWLGYLQQGRTTAPLPDLDKAIAGGSPFDLATLAGIHAMRGKRAEAEQVLSTLEELSNSRYVCPYEMATARAALGQHDRALGWLRRAVDDRSVCIPDLKTDPRLDVLRGDPRFQALLKEVGFTP